MSEMRSSLQDIGQKRRASVEISLPGCGWCSPQPHGFAGAELQRVQSPAHAGGRPELFPMPCLVPLLRAPLTKKRGLVDYRGCGEEGEAEGKPLDKRALRGKI